MFFASPNLVVLQARLFNPNYCGPGRWIIYNPGRRAAFLAVGKDEHPEIMSLLRHASVPDGLSEREILELDSNITKEQFESLVKHGLLTSSREVDALTCTESTFISKYQLSVLDYPFLDYSASNSRRIDNSLMAQYAEVSMPPPAITRRHGRMFRLPTVSKEDLGSDTEDNDRLSLKSLAAILKYTLGSLGEISGGQFAARLHKTSPSGGALHPTELLIQIGNCFGNVPAGAYVYDVLQHALVEEQDRCGFNCVDGMLIFVVRSRVERPMWRYRDIRAFRPILLDAGHVIETLALLLELKGLSVAVGPPTVATDASFDWLREPAIASVYAGVGLKIPAFKPGCSHTGYSSEDLVTGRVLTNPGMYLAFTQGSFVAHVVWPQIDSVALQPDDLAILSHCILSFRGDRKNDLKGICKSVPGASEDRVKFLRSQHVLLPSSIGEAFYSKLGLWSEHNWYPSLLAHLECYNSHQGYEQGFLQIQCPKKHPDTLIESLFARKTTRVFSEERISIDSVHVVLKHACDYGKSGTSNEVRIFVSPNNTKEVSSVLHEWCMSSSELIPLDNRRLAQEDIIRLTAGQSPAGKAAATIWLLQRVDLSKPDEYELAVINLGRVGQRICMKATEIGLGVFQTPAVSDTETMHQFRIEDPVNWVVYLFSLGALP